MFSGRSSTMTVNYYPPIDISQGGEWEIGLSSLDYINNIPNLFPGRNRFHYVKDKKVEYVTFPTGCFEIEAISSFLESKLPAVKLTPNLNTLKIEIDSPYDLDFSYGDSIGPLLGFSKKKFKAGRIVSDQAVDILPVETVRVECSLISNSSYLNGKQVHTLFSSGINVDPGFRESILITNPIYLPVDRSFIDQITVSCVDENGTPLNFQGERCFCRLHLRQRQI